MYSISVIVPFYNAEKHLQKCIESLLVQTYHNIEILLIDDGSSDHSLEIAEKYQKTDSRIKVFHKENGGVSSARNFGILHLTTRYFCFVDADDYVNQYYCEHLMNSDADYVITGLEIIRNNSDNEYFGDDTKGIKNIEYYFDNFDRLFQLQLTNSPWMRRYDKLVSGNLLFDEDQKIGEDFIFNLQYIPKCHTIEIRKYYDYYYVMNDNSATGTYHNTDLSDLKNLYQSILNFSFQHQAKNGKSVADISFRRGGLQSIHNLYYGLQNHQAIRSELSKWIECNEFTESCHNITDVPTVNKLLCKACYHKRINILMLILHLKKIYKRIKGY